MRAVIELARHRGIDAGEDGSGQIGRTGHECHGQFSNELAKMTLRLPICRYRLPRWLHSLTTAGKQLKECSYPHSGMKLTKFRFSLSNSMTDTGCRSRSYCDKRIRLGLRPQKTAGREILFVFSRIDTDCSLTTFSFASITSCFFVTLICCFCHIFVAGDRQKVIHSQHLCNGL